MLKGLSKDETIEQTKNRFFYTVKSRTGRQTEKGVYLKVGQTGRVSLNRGQVSTDDRIYPILCMPIWIDYKDNKRTITFFRRQRPIPMSIEFATLHQAEDALEGFLRLIRDLINSGEYDF